MLDTETKRRIDTARDILVGKVPDPKSQVEQITIALLDFSDRELCRLKYHELCLFFFLFLCLTLSEHDFRD